MIIPDINLLVYAYNRRAPDHERARAWWERLLSGAEPIGVPWTVTLGFIRLMTHRAVLREPLPVTVALARVHEWFDAAIEVALNPGSRHWSILSALLAKLGTGGNLVTDVHLAALSIEHNAELHSNDADFARIPGLRLVNPLQ
jgi:hypothetical protein